MKRLLLLPFLLWSMMLSGQITGLVQDQQGQPLPYVNIYLENSYTGTTSNQEGSYSLDIAESGTYTIVFQYLGYKTVREQIAPASFPFELNISLDEETVSLEEVVISATEDPAYRIIRETIARRKENLERISAFTADFYSRGLWRVKDVPEKFMGQEIGDFEGALDSTRSGIIYLSETISKIAYRGPDDFKETITASKVSGNDNGFSFNSAQDANFSFYENSVDLNAAIVSPIANNALSYYRYKLVGVFYEGGKLINKIQVIPRRPKDRVWEGVIYIVEDDWQLYGVELSTNGEAIQVPLVQDLIFKQNFKYDEQKNAWIKLSQTIDFSFKFLGFQGDGRFIAVYSNYDFEPVYENRAFTNEVVFFEPEANKKDSLYWRGIRPVPLTGEEIRDYVRKDSLQELRKSKKYLDSVDAEQNKIGVLDIIGGYTYRNTHEKWNLSYEGPVPDINFNTVQGWHGGVGLNYYKWYDENQTKWLSADLNMNYGFADDRLRFTGRVTKNFNRINRLRLGVFGGRSVRQFNSREPISPLINTVSTLFFERNYAKFYEATFAGVSYSQELFNGLRVFLSSRYEKRQPVFNNTDQTFFPNDDVNYTSNNPLDPTDSVNAAIDEHEIIRTTLTSNITFGQKYMTYPDGKYNLGNGDIPFLTVVVENGMAASNSDYNFTKLQAQVSQFVNTGNKGEFAYNLKGGTFLGGDDISFVDYQHFNGNQTRVGTAFRYTDVFNLLPYYELSTNKSYFEGHAEHNFRGWVLGKIPGINKLNFNLVVGGHVLFTESRKPYAEYSIGIDNLGWGNFRFFRIDYVRNTLDGVGDGAFVFGLKILNFID